jgi:hypothetical protein
MDATLAFLGNMFPWWMWMIFTFPFIVWGMQGFPRDSWEHGGAKAAGWWVFWILAYLLYHINYEK